MTKQEYQTVKAIIYACIDRMTIENGYKVPYVDADKVITGLDNVFADELKVPREKRLRTVYISNSATSTKQNTSKKSFLKKLFRRNKV